MSLYAEYQTAGVRRGATWIDGGRIEFSGDVDWSLDIADVAIIGEYTNARGPDLEDYFLLVFVKGNEWPYFLPNGAFGFEEMIGSLGEHLGAPLELKLFRSTNLASRILFPESQIGRRVFSLPKVPRRGWRRVFDLVVPEFELRVTEEVRAVVQGGSAAH